MNRILICLASCVFLWCAPSSAADFEAIHGHWTSIGYGWHLVIDEDFYELHEMTAVSCIVRERAKHERFEELVGQIESAKKNKTLSIRQPYRNTVVDFRHISKAPRSCLAKTHPLDSDPLYNFDVLWNTFNENYAFFDLRGVDWNAFRTQYRELINPDTTPEKLYDICAKMLGKLKDNHVSLRARALGRIMGAAPPPGLPILLSFAVKYDGESSGTSLEDYVLSRFEEFREVIARQYLTSPIQTLAGGKIAHAMLPDNIAYIALTGMSGFIQEDDDKGQQLAVLNRDLDELMDRIQNAQGAIIDIRVGGGGMDIAAQMIASRFADHERLVLRKSARFGKRYTSERKVFMAPSDGLRFLKPVIILTSPLTVSADEFFVTCMRELSNVTVVGQRTHGIHSDEFQRHLPNGWLFGLSNEVYRSANGDVYERIGIPPDVELPVLRKTELASGVDAALEKAISLIPTQ